MTDLRDFSGQQIPDVIMEDASAWMSVLDSERCNAADRGAFARWLEADLRHRAAYEEISLVWARLRTLNDVQPLLDQPKVRQIKAARAATDGPPAVVRSDWSALAVTLLLVAGLSVHWQVGEPGIDHATARGQMQQVELTDGTLIEMSAATAFESKLDARRRQIRLTAGEAVFHVSRDERPFVVSTMAGNLTALGTVFSVSATSEALEVAVLEGAVAVEPRVSPLQVLDFDANHLPLAKSRFVLEAGDWLVLTASHSTQLKPGVEELSSALAWRSGVIDIDQLELGDVAKKINRHTLLNVHLADPELNEIRVSGQLNLADPAAFVAQLGQVPQIKLNDSGQGWITLRRQNP